MNCTSKEKTLLTVRVNGAGNFQNTLRVCLWMLVFSGAFFVWGNPLLFASGNSKAKAVLFNPSASEFQVGAMSLGWSSTSPLKILFNGQVMADITWRPTPSKPGWIPELSNFDTSVSPETKSVTQTSAFSLNPKDKSEQGGSFQQKVSLNDKGKIELEFEYSCLPERASGFKTFIANIMIPKNIAAGKTLRINKQVIQIPVESEWGVEDKWQAMGGQGKVTSCEFSSAGSGFELKFKEPIRAVSAFRSKNNVVIYLSNHFSKSEGKLNYSLRLISSE